MHGSRFFSQAEQRPHPAGSVNMVPALPALLKPDCRRWLPRHVESAEMRLCPLVRVLVGVHALPKCEAPKWALCGTALQFSVTILAALSFSHKTVVGSHLPASSHTDLRPVSVRSTRRLQGVRYASEQASRQSSVICATLILPGSLKRGVRSGDVLLGELNFAARHQFQFYRLEYAQG